MNEVNARPETLLPATLICTKKDDGGNNGHYEVTIPLIYLIEAMKSPAQFYKFRFIGLKYKETKSGIPTNEIKEVSKTP